MRIAPLLLLPLLLLTAAAPDPMAWLEEVDGARAITQVKAWNAATLEILEKTPDFAATRDRAQKLLEDPAKIATPTAVYGDQVLNHWQDAKNPRGLWRIATLGSFTAGKPAWRVLIDVDALGKAENMPWDFKGADCLAPGYRKCLVSLSRGGADATVVREFDTVTKSFISGGFTLPEAKSSVRKRACKPWASLRQS